jgi:hypothetical protein
MLPANAATFTFDVAGTPVSYRWHRNGVPLVDGGAISGSASRTLSIAPASAAGEGLYHCVASNQCFSVTSRAASLRCRPRIDTQPVGGVFVGGQAVTLSVEATAGATYRWRRNGVNVFNGIVYSGVATPSLTINADEPSQGGAYSVAITNACGTTISDVAVVEVTCPADFNNDGGADGQDVVDFFEAWSGGESSSDLNFDGGIDGADVTSFYARWENGC